MKMPNAADLPGREGYHATPLSMFLFAALVICGFLFGIHRHYKPMIGSD